MSKSIIGCDLNERYCQISYYHEELEEPQTMENVTYPVQGLYEKAIEQRIDPAKDLDGISPVNRAKVFAGEQPSIAAASSNAFGIALIKFVYKKIPCGS